MKTQGKFNDLRYTFEDIFDAFGERAKLENLDNKYFYNGNNKQIAKNSGTSIVFNITPLTVRSDLFGDEEDDNINMSKIYGLDYFKKFEFAIKFQYAQDIGRNYITKEHISPLVARARHRCADLSKIFSVYVMREYEQRKKDVVEVVSVESLRVELKKLIPMIICKTNYDIQKKKKSKNENASTLHIIVDEAHNILSTMSTRESEEWKDYRIESFEEIIKEGRKFGTFLIISSQRPSDISDTIISQLHNYFIHRLVNDEDIRKIYKTVAFADKETNEMIPILPAGGCVFAGLASNFPLLAQINMLSNNRPNSGDVSLSEVWGELNE